MTFLLYWYHFDGFNDSNFVSTIKNISIYWGKYKFLSRLISSKNYIKPTSNENTFIITFRFVKMTAQTFMINKCLIMPLAISKYAILSYLK